MTVQNLPIPVLDETELILNQHTWTLEQYEMMIESGVLGDTDKVELLFGKIVNMSPIGVSHSYVMQEMAEFMITKYRKKYICRQEQPVAFPLHSMPEPDYVLARKMKHRFRKKRPQPEDVRLIVEVADSTLGRDRGPKAKLYASYGIQEYWIINLIDHHLELHTEPTEKEGYESIVFFSRDETFDSPLLGSFAVGNVLPRSKWEEE
ncbi:Uma2 family endonuclease [Neolewinella agarilytica]|uniref:Uma2 family endonuclease n=1 Tax=Neolewinella agarilytica TaxID=478744 RepID=UPI0023544DCB|nr:Uma2 family endonuclease [Neolewinella agarilytica]